MPLSAQEPTTASVSTYHAELRVALAAKGVAAGCLGDYASDHQRTALYRLYDAKGDLLYVGISKDFGQRWKQHASSQPWWFKVQRQTVEWYETRNSALDAEAAAIKAERPAFNVIHAVGKVPAAFAKVEGA
jgi:predicted GIY-YIG superfamily endonuclease